jgi:LacI family transcriptional regulator
MATIKDVAKACGVSTMTVSYVFNDKPGAVGEATRLRVLQVARELNYQPNRMARSLGRRRSQTLGMVISDLRNPFYVEMLECAETLAAEAGYQVIVETRRGPTGRLAGWPVDGFLMWARPEQTLEAFLGPQSAPVVYWGDARREDGSDIVGLDLYSGSRAAAEYAVRRGYKSWAYVSTHYRSDFRFERRFCAWDDVCREANLRMETLWPREADKPENIRANCREIGLMLAGRPPLRRPKLVACYNDVAAIAVINGLRRGGLRVPEDVAVVGFDGIEEGQLLDRPLTTVKVPVEALCKGALEILLARIEGESGAAHQVTVPSQLLEGETA